MSHSPLVSNPSIASWTCSECRAYVPPKRVHRCDDELTVARDRIEMLEDRVESQVELCALMNAMLDDLRDENLALRRVRKP